MNFPERGAVYKADLNPTLGRELKKARPVVIVSNNHLNEFSDMVIIMPVTAGQHQYYHDVPLYPPEGGTTKKSIIVTEQVRAIDQRRLGKQLGFVSEATMKAIEAAIMDHFGLPEGNLLP